MKKPEEKPIKRADIELHADAWTRFERAVDTVAKAPPQHKTTKKKTDTKKNTTKAREKRAKSSGKLLP
jgi:hypothetical protein